MEEAFVALVLADPAIAALIGDRFTPDEPAQPPVYPNSTYSVISEAPDYNHDGESGWTRYRVQLDHRGTDNPALSGKAQVVLVGRAFRSLLSGKAEIEHSGHRFEALEIDIQSDTTEGGKGGSIRVRRRRCDITFWHKEL